MPASAQPTAASRRLNVLVVEDEVLLALELAALIEDAGHRPVGSAGDAAGALALAPYADLALVDLNLRDGRSGPAIAQALSRRGVAVVFATANPAQIPDDFCGALGVLDKPYAPRAVLQTLAFVAALGSAPAPGRGFTAAPRAAA